MGPAAPPLDPLRVVEDPLRIRQARAPEELDEVVVVVGQAEDLAGGGHTATAGRAGAVDDYRCTHASRVHRVRLLEHAELRVRPADLAGPDTAAGDGLEGLLAGEWPGVVAGLAAVAEVDAVDDGLAALP